MSKELEALNKIKHASLTVVEHDDTSGSITIIPIVNTEEYETIKNYLTPPTADEVCKALSEWFDEKFYYDVNQKEFYTKALNGQHSVVKLKNNEINFGGWYVMPPHLITLIGRFYEAQQ